MDGVPLLAILKAARGYSRADPVDAVTYYIWRDRPRAVTPIRAFSD